VKYIAISIASGILYVRFTGTQYKYFYSDDV